MGCQIFNAGIPNQIDQHKHDCGYFETLYSIDFNADFCPSLCVEMDFTWTFPRNQDANMKLKSELISIKFQQFFNTLADSKLICPIQTILLKFIQSEKATKFCNIFTLLLTGTTQDKSKVKISQNFVVFSKYINFKKKKSNVFFQDFVFFQIHLNLDILTPLTISRGLKLTSFIQLLVSFYIFSAKLLLQQHSFLSL